MSTVGNAGVSATSDWSMWEPIEQVVPTRDLFDVVILGINKLELRPRTELAKSILAMWLIGDIKVALRSRGGSPSEQWHYGKSTEALELTLVTPPLIATGDDAYFTGIRLSDEEARAARAYIERRRQTARRASKKARKQ